MRSAVAVVGCIVATLAFSAYARTLLPGVDLGDTGGFQAAVLWPGVSARQAYPLYYALARPFVAALSPENPARGLNLFSALWAAIAVGLLTGITAIVSRSLLGGVAAGLLLAFSYTFWTQAVIAEVYSLHLALIGCCLVALAAYAERPCRTRLAVFLAVYALSFGNHLSMILLLIPFATFLLMTTEPRATLVRAPTLALAAAIAVGGALQYLPNLLAVWTSLDAPEQWTERIAAFWFDVTKADWRESMVLGVAHSEIADRFAMFLFDANQQFGLGGLVCAVAGAIVLRRTNRPWAALVLIAYLVNTVFAFTYNVGDPHVFFLPSHYFVALMTGCFVAAAARRTRVAAVPVAVLTLAYAAWRGYDTWPAADRHTDRRAAQLVEHLTFGINERDALLVTALNWQIENALLYETRYRKTDVVWVRLSDVFLHFPFFIRDNHASRRDIVLTSAAASQVSMAFGSLLPIVSDPLPPTPTLSSTVARIPRGSAYALMRLTPPRGELLDEDMFEEVLSTLTGSAVAVRIPAPYEVWIGRFGEAPLLYRSSPRPFRGTVRLPEGDLEIRLEGWVPLETFRRGGYGHVTLDRAPLMTVERGVSLVWLDAHGPATPFYAAGLYATRPRFRIPATGIPQVALLH